MKSNPSDLVSTSIDVASAAQKMFAKKEPVRTPLNPLKWSRPSKIMLAINVSVSLVGIGFSTAAIMKQRSVSGDQTAATSQADKTGPQKNTPRALVAKQPAP